MIEMFNDTAEPGRCFFLPIVQCYRIYLNFSLSSDPAAGGSKDQLLCAAHINIE